MFKKRGITKPNIAQQSNSKVQTQNHKQPHLIKTGAGIDLRKDIQQMENLIVSNKKEEKSQRSSNDIHNNKAQNQEQQKGQNQLFKTKKINKFTNHILKNLPKKTTQQLYTKTYQPSSSIKQQNIQQNKLIQNRETQKKQPQNHLQDHNKQLVRPNLNNYGLLDKTHFKQSKKLNYQQIQAAQGKDHQQVLMDYYVKKKMQEINKKSASSSNPTKFYASQYSIHKQPQAWEQVLQIQKQYLRQQQKVKQYSMQEIQKKLEKVSQQTIRQQMQKRTVYLKDLLENQHERLEYASKKQLKMMKQDKDRIQKQLNSKYRQTGRRNYFQSIKHSVL